MQTVRLRRYPSRKPRGEPLSLSTDVWLCSRHCGARGLTYAGALRRKTRLDLLSWGDLRRATQALIAAHSDEPDGGPIQ
jgi:hypothetical protein